MPAALASLLVLLTPAISAAGPFLERLREQDLNDYALGLAYSTTQNPYVGTSNSTLAYPYLTSFEHSAFTDNWLLIRGENAGFRFVTDSDWEFGLIGRLQTLGPGVANNDELQGIDERGWAIETGPLIGWRGWPVHVQFRSYWELPNRHDGMSSELEFSLPLQYWRGFFVPAVKLTYMSAGYSDHYFSVSEQESTPSRPAYQPGAATNIWAGFALGYELAPRWLLKTSVGVEHLDASITASPIVARDRQWSGSVGLAYNANLFVPRDHEGTLGESAVEIRLGTFSSAIDTSVRRNTGNGQGGDEVDLEDLLGAADRKSVFQIDASIRSGYYHQFQLGYFELRRQSATTLDRNLSVGDSDYLEGSEIETSIESSLLRFSYAYSLMRDGQKELGVKAGLSYIRFDAELGEVGAQQVERLKSEAPLPTVGALGTIALNDNWRVGADLDLFALDFDRYRGFMGFLRLDLERKLGDAFGVGLGYNFYALRLTSKDEDLGGRFDLRYHGPKLYVSFAF